MMNPRTPSRYNPPGFPPQFYLPHGEEFGQSAGSDITTMNMASGNGNYARPNIHNGMNSNSSRSCSERTDDSASSSKPLVHQTSDHKDCADLEASNGRLKIVFIILVFFCVVAVAVYSVVIVCLIIALGKMNPHSGHSSLVSGSQTHKHCVSETKLDSFINIWDPKDQKDITDILRSGDFEYSTGRGQAEGTYCFSTLQWVPRIMGEIYKKVQESVKYIEDQQTYITDKVKAYTAENPTNDTDCQKRESAVGQWDVTNPRLAVYAHFFVDTNRSYPPNTMSSLKWIREGQKFSGRKNMEVNPVTGRFIVRHSGYYFIYTHLVFRNNSVHKAHRVMKEKSGDQAKLLESIQSPSSSLQGVFKLRTNDTLRVEATAGQLDDSRDKSSYFGAYLIRT